MDFIYIYVLYQSFYNHLLYIMMKKISLTSFQKIIFIVSFVIGVWLFFDILRKRTDFLKRFNLEGFENSGIGNKTGSGLLKSCKQIKASANSALDVDGTIVLGSDSDNRGLFKVISRGCRFFDFEIYSIGDNDGANKPEVGYSTSSDFSSLQTNTIPVADVLDKIMECAFTNPAPNPLDPVLIQFRMKSAKIEIYDFLADDLVRCCGSRLVRDLSSSSRTDLSDIKSKTFDDLKGKIIVIVCTTNANQKSSNPSIKKININKMFTDNEKLTKLYKEGNQMVLHTHIDAKESIYSDPYNILPLDLSINMPGIDSSYKSGNVTFDSTNTKIIPFKFYSPDEALIDYEEYFKNSGTAFVISSST